MNAPAVDPDTGRVALTRTHLTALTRLGAGHDLADQARNDLQGVGALRDGQVHPLLQPVIRTLTAAHTRGALRRWQGGTRPVVEVLAGLAGVVVLAGGSEPDAAQEVRWHPRPSAVARVVAELLDLPTEDGPPPLDGSPRPWSELIELASRPHTGIGLADLRWASRLGLPLASVLVIAWHRDGGIVEIAPVDKAQVTDDGGGEPYVRCSPRHPIEIWTGLTALASRVAGRS